MDIQIQQLIDKNNKYIKTICEWQENWWGVNYKKEKVYEWMTRCLNKNSLPQTYIAISNNQVVGMYQIAMDDDIDIRPDYYPWLVNVYVDEKNRGQGICTILLDHAKNKFKELNIKRVYLNTDHVNLYEKYGFKYLETIETFKGQRTKIYYLDII